MDMTKFRDYLLPPAPTLITRLVPYMLGVGLLVRLALWAKDYFAG
jgi:hypothetical protein